MAAKTPDRSPPDHHPYVPDDQHLPEFTWGAVIIGSLLGIVFGASSLYMALKVGLTVSASIPVAVLSITLFRGLSKVFRIRRASILENNIVQTTGSAGESIAFGVGVTMPALMILGYEMDVGRVMVVSILGGLLGILMMIPLRRAFIVKQHGTLKYPEGTACADVLIVGEQGGSSARTVFLGFGVAFVYQFLMQAMKLWQEIPTRAIGWYKGAVAAIEVNPALLGIGYIIGTRIASTMAAGGVMVSFVLIPLIRLFGDPATAVIFPAKATIHDLSEHEISKQLILYIGAGAVTTGGIISLVRALPLIIGSIAAAARDMRAARGGEATALRRTDRDMPIWIVGAGSLLLVGAIWGTSILHQYVAWVPQLEVNWLGALMIVLFGFLFVTVSSRLTGEIGSSSNPVSGMTVATLLLTCIAFFFWHHTQYAANPQLQSNDLLAAISVAAVVCIAASNGGTTSQDLKTGFLVGATPYRQQWAIVIGTLTSAAVIGIVLIVLNNASTIYSKRDLPELRRPLDVSKLTEFEQARYDDDKTMYHVWRAPLSNAEEVPAGKYLVDDAGRIRYLVDPGINGSLKRTDKGDPVSKFDAPKAALMALISDGILRQKLPWTLVLLGVSIAIVLELCSVPSLPFAVGVYLPMSASAPIFVGGLIRFIADRYSRGGTGKPRTEAESDMSPGVLLSTGYIAGGSIAGILIAFLIAFSTKLPATLAQWEHREMTLPEGRSLQDQLLQAAVAELGIAKGTEKEYFTEINKSAYEIFTFNETELYKQFPAPAGTMLKLRKDRSYQNYRSPKDESLGAIALEQLGSAEDAKTLFTDNQNALPPIDTFRLPAGTVVRFPQPIWPALTAFGVLCGLLALTGLGWIMSGGTASAAPKRAAPTAPQDSSGKTPERKPPSK